MPRIFIPSTERGTDNAALASAYTAARAAFLDNIDNAQLKLVPNLSTLTALRISYLDARLSTLRETEFGKITTLEAVIKEFYGTLTDWRRNAATGTCIFPERINSGQVSSTAVFSNVDEYAEIDLGFYRLLNQYRYNGIDAHNKDGSYKLQYYDVDVADWVDWVTEIPTREHSWSEFIAAPAIRARLIRLVATTLDSKYGSNSASAWEVYHS